MSISDAMRSVFYRRALPWACQACLLLLYVLSVLRLHPANFFGIMPDDTIYFSFGKALAAGKGYILPSLPGTPPATKYLILYAWILSWVWLWNSAFPANLAGALGITKVFGIAYVILAFLFLQQLRGIGDAEALLLTAFCAPGSDGSLLQLERPLGHPILDDGARCHARREPRNAGRSPSCGSARLRNPGGSLDAHARPRHGHSGRSYQRSIGTPRLDASRHGRACTIPVFAWTAWNAIASEKAARPAGFDSGGPGFRQTWIYYMTYLGFRKLSMPNANLVATMLMSQVTYFFTELPSYFLSPLFHRNLGLLLACTIAVFWMVFSGMLRQVKNAEWQPVHFALPSALLKEKREAYAWIRQNTPEDGRVVAGEDGSLYLYTGRQAMAHIALQPAGAYDEAYLRKDLGHMTDVAKAIDAHYWLASSDDSDKQWVAAKPFLAARYNEIEGALPEVFRSSRGHVRIYDLGCVQHPEVPACQTADPVLFPEGSENPSRSRRD